ncbi:MAG: hypothetical protein ACR2Q4_01865 [Geminicoccaceae bacterium]
MADEAVLCHELLVCLQAKGSVGPDAAHPVAFVEQATAQHAPFTGGIGGLLASDQAIAAIKMWF